MTAPESFWQRLTPGSIQANKIEAGVIEDPDGELERMTQSLIDDLRGSYRPNKSVDTN